MLRQVSCRLDGLVLGRALGVQHRAVHGGVLGQLHLQRDANSWSRLIGARSQETAGSNFAGRTAAKVREKLTASRMAKTANATPKA